MNGAAMSDKLTNNEVIKWALLKLKTQHELLTEQAWETKLTEWVTGPTDKLRGKTCNKYTIHLFTVIQTVFWAGGEGFLNFSHDLLGLIRR